MEKETRGPADDAGEHNRLDSAILKSKVATSNYISYINDICIPCSLFISQRRQLNSKTGAGNESPWKIRHSENRIMPVLARTAPHFPTTNASSIFLAGSFIGYPALVRSWVMSSPV